MCVHKSPVSWDGPQLALKEDVFFCLSEGQGIFLDLAQDDYSAIPIPERDSCSGGHLSDEELCVVLEPYRSELIEAGLITDTEARAPGFQSYRAIVRPVGHIFGEDDQRAFGLPDRSGASRRISSADVVGFAWASWRARRLLKTRHIRDVVRAVRMRKARAVMYAKTDHALQQHVAIFRKLRPWFPASYLCLYDALALIEFLALKNLFPTWVFGVQAQPFGAHCWLQSGDELLNESREYAGQFTPIMAV
ncbi:MAG: lasso peptide biosynthesis B2 protein [Burkholderiales bacterium]|nr:MAG: lasso peptide biosynthesis B2 protein [Burkholderiales bacterium]